MKKRSQSDLILDTSAATSRPLKDKDGHILNDHEFINRAYDIIMEFENNDSICPGLDGSFIEFVKESKKELDGGMPISTWKRRHLQRTIPDFSIFDGVK